VITHSLPRCPSIRSTRNGGEFESCPVRSTEIHFLVNSHTARPPYWRRATRRLLRAPFTMAHAVFMDVSSYGLFLMDNRVGRRAGGNRRN
jgi:hypothetical protein